MIINGKQPALEIINAFFICSRTQTHQPILVAMLFGNPLHLIQKRNA
jgi:hypothetical protein